MLLVDENLFEHTPLTDKFLPMNVFHKHFPNARIGDVVCHPHWHDHLETIIVTKGQAAFYIDSREYIATAGDIFFVNSEELHVGYARKNNALVEYYAIVFNRSLLTPEISDPWYEKFISPFLESEMLLPTRIFKTEEHYSLIKNHILNIIKEFQDKNNAYEFIIKSQLNLLIAYIARYYLKRRKKSNLETQAQFKELITFVSKHLERKITIEDAARFVNLSPYHFCKTFKKLTGRTFIEFINMLRINKAEKLLTSTDLPVTVISDIVGCCNSNYFGKMFKKYKNISPSEFRKAMEHG